MAEGKDSFPKCRRGLVMGVRQIGRFSRTVIIGGGIVVCMGGSVVGLQLSTFREKQSS